MFLILNNFSVGGQAVRCWFICCEVVDVYQEWCGPCKALLSTFKRVKNEIGDDLLRFATVWQMPVLGIAVYSVHLRDEEDAFQQYRKVVS